MSQVKSVQPMSWTRRDAIATFQAMVVDRHKEIGRSVARLRESQGMSQETLANKAGLSTRTVSRLENGVHEGRGNTMRVVAEALGVEVETLLQLRPGERAGDLDPAEVVSQADRIEAKLDTLLERFSGLDDLEQRFATVWRLLSAPDGEGMPLVAEVNDLSSGVMRGDFAIVYDEAQDMPVVIEAKTQQPVGRVSAEVTAAGAPVLVLMAHPDLRSAPDFERDVDEVLRGVESSRARGGRAGRGPGTKSA